MAIFLTSALYARWLSEAHTQDQVAQPPSLFQSQHKEQGGCMRPPRSPSAFCKPAKSHQDGQVKWGGPAKSSQFVLCVEHSPAGHKHEPSQ